jgi:hypothetical protein
MLTRRSLPRRIVGALAGDALALALRLPGGVLVGLVVAPALALGTVLLVAGARGIEGVGSAQPSRPKQAP